jgi:hypothetical protein
MNQSDQLVLSNFVEQTCWPHLNPHARDLESQILGNILGLGMELGQQVHEIADLSGIENLRYMHDRVQELCGNWTPRRKLKRILGSDNETYMFLGKPKDDLRKDARIMDFNSIINKLLKANSESRRRQLRTSGIDCTTYYLFAI